MLFCFEFILRGNIIIRSNNVYSIQLQFVRSCLEQFLVSSYGATMLILYLIINFPFVSAIFILLEWCIFMTSGCLNAGGSRNNQAKNYRSGRNYFSSSSSSFDSSRNTIKRRYYTLNNGVEFQSTTHIHTEEGEPIFGR